MTLIDPFLQNTKRVTRVICDLLDGVLEYSLNDAQFLQVEFLLLCNSFLKLWDGHLFPCSGALLLCTTLLFVVGLIDWQINYSLGTSKCFVKVGWNLRLVCVISCTFPLLCRSSFTLLFRVGVLSNDVYEKPLKYSGIHRWGLCILFQVKVSQKLGSVQVSIHLQLHELHILSRNVHLELIEPLLLLDAVQLICCIAFSLLNNTPQSFTQLLQSAMKFSFHYIIVAHILIQSVEIVLEGEQQLLLSYIWFFEVNNKLVLHTMQSMQKELPIVSRAAEY
mmetsp:Transcript_9030/g.33305  ORF Transcript_9030/g.33305 Transcript_9030/m.33305 type:complete len:278 (-) Transcript_9030:2413-3246(-)